MKVHCPQFVSLYPKSFDRLFSITQQLIQGRKSSGIEVGDFIDRLADILDRLEDPLTPGGNLVKLFCP